MQIADELHHLVHSLTASEKRAFTMHARRHVKNPQYLRLFTTLDRLKVYDANVVRGAFKGTLAENNLTELRYALLEELVACVDRLQPQDDVVVRLQREADAIEFLAARGCYSTAERRIRRARSSALSNELPSALLDLCAVQRRTMPLTSRLLNTLIEDERFALELARHHHDAARELDVWTQRASSCERFEPLLEPLTNAAHHEHSESSTHHEHSEHSSLGTLRRLHAGLLRAACERDADVFVTRAHTLSVLLAEHSDKLAAYRADVNNALIDLADEAALLGVTSRLAGLSLPPARHHTHLPRHRVATFMRNAIAAVTHGEMDAASRMVSHVLGDSELSQAHEAWTSQATLLSVMLNVLSGNHKIVAHLVRSALRTEQRRRRFTGAEREFLKVLQNPNAHIGASLANASNIGASLANASNIGASLANASNIGETNVGDGTGLLPLLIETLRKHFPIASESEQAIRSTRSKKKPLRIRRF
ncbi:MAG: hypothetical protein SGJ05_02575 [bacterium]|nr:hypothetical protein [bacterium]